MKKTSLIFILMIIFSACSKRIMVNKNLSRWSNEHIHLQNMPLAEKGNSPKNGYKFVEKINKFESTEYWLLNMNQDSIKLDLKTDSSSKLLYYEISKNMLLVLVNHFEQADIVSLYNFQLNSGEILKHYKGQIPCKTEFKFNWKLGNSSCEWINFKKKKIAFVKKISPFEAKLLEYNLESNNEVILETKVKGGLSAFGGYVVDHNVHYNNKSNHFKFKNDY